MRIDRNKSHHGAQRIPPRKQPKHQRRSLMMLRKNIEHQVRLAYARFPLEATELVAMRLRTREDLVNRGYLRVEELETLRREDALALAFERIDRSLTAAERQRL